jgi:hypothetical protein
MFKPNYDSFYKQHANTTRYWLQNDRKELYELNLKSNYDLLKNNNWIDNSFTYKFNSHGFRCDEFTDEPSIMFLGCSFTCGIGLPIDYIWPELVSKKLNMRCANLGIGGSSIDTAFRLCHGWIDIIKPQIVILLEPPGVRVELVYNDTIVNLNTGITVFENGFIASKNLQNPNHNNHQTFIKEWSLDDNNDYFNKIKNKLAIESICSARNIKCLSIPFKEIFKRKVDLARDLSHYGIKSNQLFADYILTKI